MTHHLTIGTLLESEDSAPEGGSDVKVPLR